MDVISDLITKYKCVANCENIFKDTPLHYASSAGHLEVVRYFINEQHCDPMTKDKYKGTPLHYACQLGHPHIVQYLLSIGKVDPLAKDHKGKTPVDLAIRHKNCYDLLKLFRSSLLHCIQLGRVLCMCARESLSCIVEKTETVSVDHNSSYVLIARSTGVLPLWSLASGSTLPMDNRYCTMWGWPNWQA